MKKIIYALFFARSSKISSANDKRNSIHYLIFLLFHGIWSWMYQCGEKFLAIMEKGSFSYFVQYLGDFYYDEQGNWNG